MKIKLFLFFLLLCNVTLGQQSFVVYQLKGTVNVRMNAQWRPVQIGQVVKSNDILFVDKGGSVVLICESYHAFTIKEPGNHRLSQYVRLCLREKYSITKKYFQYIWDEFTHAHGTPEKNRRKYMQNVTAVVRGCPGVTIDPLLDTINNSAGDMKIKWELNTPGGAVSFVLFDSNLYGNELYSTASSQNYVSLDTLRNYIGAHKEVYWNIKINGTEACDRKLIKFWSSSEYKTFKNRLTQSLKEMNNSAEKYFATGFLLEANHFFAEAKEFYKKASELKPDEVRYRQPVEEL